jgi:hypothetical protein
VDRAQNDALARARLLEGRHDLAATLGKSDGVAGAGLEAGLAGHTAGLGA